jgi:glycosyltransferase involved in cell wall biosynthesis
MRILVNGRTLCGQRTGIGWYTYRLLLALAEQPEVKDVGVALGGRIVGLSEVADRARSAKQSAGGLVRGIVTTVRQLASDFVPLARDLLVETHALRLRRQCHRWTLFHEPNYVSPRLPLPLVTTVCDLSFASCPQWMPRERRLWLNRSLGESLARSRAIITISQFTRAELLAHFPQLDQERVFATPLGVDHGRFNATRGNVDETLHARLQLPPRFVLYLGTLEPRKNLQGLLEAFARLPSSLQQEFPLVLAGVRGWKRGYFQSRLSELTTAGVVHTLGYVAQADIPALLRAATVLAFPSLYEGFGLPVLEAAACGTPVLCSCAASLPEVMGEAACFVDPTSADDIATALVRLLDDEALRRNLSEAGRERSQLFSWERCAADTLQAYRAAA